ncbi:MAG TPA: hypothetical protein VF647_19770 [Longimicrobium sp.]|jgi:hypothetical protein
MPLSAQTLWSDGALARRFIIPDDAELPAGEFHIRTSLGRERSVDEAAVLAYEVTKEEAQGWAKEQLGGVLGEVRGKALGFVVRLRERTAAMREENRAAWEQGVAEMPDDVREAAERARAGLKELGQALQRAAREHRARPETHAPAAAEKPDDAGATGANPPDPGAS